MAYLAQQLPATDNLTVSELVQFGRYPWRGLLGRMRQEDYAHIERAMTLTSTLPLADRIVETLSGGERQRAWLAMLLAQGSRHLFLDEPLASLDIAHQVEVMALIRRLCHELRLGVVVVIHDVNMTARYCDHIVTLHSSRLMTQPARATYAGRHTRVYLRYSHASTVTSRTSIADSRYSLKMFMCRARCALHALPGYWLMLLWLGVAFLCGPHRPSTPAWLPWTGPWPRPCWHWV